MVALTKVFLFVPYFTTLEEMQTSLFLWAQVGHVWAQQVRRYIIQRKYGGHNGHFCPRGRKEAKQGIKSQFCDGEQERKITFAHKK